MTDITFDCDDCGADVSAVRAEAQARCAQWNWNCNIAEIASELSAITTTGRRDRR